MLSGSRGEVMCCVSMMKKENDQGYTAKRLYDNLGCSERGEGDAAIKKAHMANHVGFLDLDSSNLARLLPRVRST